MAEINYYYDSLSENRQFTHSLESNNNSLAPFNALREAPEFKDGFWPCEKNGAWVLIESFIGQYAYNKKNKESMLIQKLGPVDDDYTLLVPCKYDEWNGEKWVKNEKLEEEERINNITKEKNERINIATEQISILQYGESIQQLTDSEILLLKKWQEYRFLVNRIDVKGSDCIFPDEPTL
ncbi:tail fiber assembly protein (plasmid) [Orbus sturtevantii]|uniref:tail fiber assembly protein n=1 Tax=Orbus sturtevantii TaxID=3074109 RepID=UPI00370DA0D2